MPRCPVLPYMPKNTGFMQTPYFPDRQHCNRSGIFCKTFAFCKTFPSGFRHLFLWGFLACVLFCGKLQAQTGSTAPETEEEAYLRQIAQIQTDPLEILPASDCRLAQLESGIFENYYREGREIPLSLQLAMRKKRQDMDFMRSHIDSLYYIQALQALNQDKPDWDAAMENIEKSLLHNRFFTRSVLFKMNYLLKRERNAEACLSYLNATLQEFSHPQKLQKTAQTTYNALLDQTGKLIEHKLYRDALSLCELIHQYCQPGFPIHYLPYKEKLLVNRAHQGVYNSYCAVALKAFEQGQDQLAGQYALLAHQYYMQNEAHMSGIDHALELLDRIAARYHSFALQSDEAEKAYYEALIDSIESRTGMALFLEEPYDPEQDIALDMEMLRPHELETDLVVPAFVPLTVDSISSSIQDLTSRQARNRFDQAMEQAAYFRAKREFHEAQAWFDLAKALQSRYPFLRGSSSGTRGTGSRASGDKTEFQAAYDQNLLQSMEQLLNKAIYHLWNAAVLESENYQQQALQLFAAYQNDPEGDPATLTGLQLMLDNFQRQKNTRYCEQLEREFAKAETEYFNQVSYGNYALAHNRLESLQKLADQYKLPEHAACPGPEKRLQESVRIFERWTAYIDSMERAEACLEKGDTLAFIHGYLQADSSFSRLGLEQYTAAAPSLFSHLSAMRQFRILSIWAQECVRQGNMPQARFLNGYLSAVGYSDQGMEKLRRSMRKQEKGGGK